MTTSRTADSEGDFQTEEGHEHPTNKARQDRCVALVRAVRANDRGSDAAFEELLSIVRALLRRLAQRHSKPGLGYDELYSEALYLLRYQVVERYRLEDGDRKSFVAFAALVIERRLISLSLSGNRRASRTVSLSPPRDGERAEGSGGGLAPAIAANRMTTASRERREAPDPSGEAERRDEMEHLKRLLLAELSPLERSVYEKVGLCGLSYDEAAAALGISAKSVDCALVRARRKGEAIYAAYLASQR